MIDGPPSLPTCGMFSVIYQMLLEQNEQLWTAGSNLRMRMSFENLMLNVQTDGDDMLRNVAILLCGLG